MSMFQPGSALQAGGPRRNQEGCPGNCRLFPLPLMELPEADLNCSRRSAQKRSRDIRQRWEMNEAIRSLNWMHGYSFVDSSTGLPNSLQTETYDRLFRLVMDAGSLGDSNIHQLWRQPFRVCSRAERTTVTLLAPSLSRPTTSSSLVCHHPSKRLLVQRICWLLTTVDTWRSKSE